jgi:hypothetical protein
MRAGKANMRARVAKDEDEEVVAPSCVETHSSAEEHCNPRQRARRSKQGLPLRPSPRGHFPTFGTAAGAGRDMGMQ